VRFEEHVRTYERGRNSKIKKIYTEEFHNSFTLLSTKYYSGDQAKEGEIGGTRSMDGEMRSTDNTLVVEPQGKEPLFVNGSG
jgi:hypothetical protein